MKLYKTLTVTGICVQLAFVCMAATAHAAEKAPKYPHVEKCYRLDAKALEKAAPRLDGLKNSDDFKDIMGLAKIVDSVKDDFNRRAKDGDRSYEYWSYTISPGDVLNAKAYDLLMKKRCVKEISQMERDYLETNLIESGYLRHISTKKQKQFMDKVIEVYADQARQIEATSAR